MHMNKVMREQMKRVNTYWYETVTAICPVCGKETTIRTRRYIPKPSIPEQQHVYSYVYDYCDNTAYKKLLNNNYIIYEELLDDHS